MNRNSVRSLLRCYPVLAAAVCLMALAAPAVAQVLYGSVTGTVTDQTGAVVPGVQLTASNDDTGLKRQAVSDGAGIYRFLDLPPGPYTIDAAASGFRPIRRTGVIVVIGQVNAQDLQLVVGTATQEVTVESSAAVLQTQKADVRTEITSHAIRNLPLNVYRNFQGITLLAPGVFSISAIADSYPNGLASGPERSMSIYSNGLPSRINNTRIDGATSRNTWLPDHVLVVPPQETIQEANVQTATYGVEKGLTAGVATDVVTKSGTNNVHGSIYAYHTNDALVARNFFDYNPKKAKRVHNNDGVTFSGPIKRNRLFYFLNWDGYWENKHSAGTGLIPPQDYREGDYNAVLGSPLFDGAGNPVNVCTTEGGITQLRQGMVFDPATGNPLNGTGRCVFSHNGRLNVIPPGRIAAGARNYWKLLREPRIPGAITVNTAFNDYHTTITRFNRQIGTAKTDWNRNDRHTIWGKWTLQEATVSVPMQYGAAGGSTGYNGLMRTQTGTVGHTWTLSPALVLTGHVGYSKQRTDAFAANHGEPLGQTVLGVPGTNEPMGNELYTGLPLIAIAGWATLGNGDNSTPYTRRDLSLTIAQNLAWLRGRHEIRMGFDASSDHINHFQPEQCCMRGALRFSQGNTSINLPADPANPANGQFMQLYTSPVPSSATYAGRGYSTYVQNSIAAFNLGRMYQVDKSVQFIDFTAGSFPFALYIGDRWKATPKFTVDVGLRWEYFPMITRDGTPRFELYNPETNTLLFGGIGGNPTHLGVTTSKKLFNPRVGLAYQVGDDMVVRAGYGIANDSMPLERPLRGFYPMVIAASSFHPSSFVSAFLPYTDFERGVPLLSGPDISSGKITPPSDVTVGTIAPGPFKRGYVQSWNVFVERRLPGDILLSTGYVGNHFVNMFNGRNINAAPLGAGSAGQPLAKYNRYLTTYQFAGDLNSHYHSLQVSLNRRAVTGLFLQGSYTWSKAMAYADDNTYGNQLRFNCPPSAAMPEGCMRLNYAPTSYDRTHMLRMAFVYELPFGSGKRWSGSSRPVNAIIGGWRVNGMFTALSGAPLTLTQGSSVLNTPGTTPTPTVTAPPKYIKDQAQFGNYSGIYWFDPSTFVPNLTPMSIGNMPRRLSWLRGPGVVQLDASVFRHFRFQERWDLEVRAEAMNALNATHFGDPATACSVVGNSCLGSFGQIRSAFGQRIVQLGAALRF